MHGKLQYQLSKHPDEMASAVFSLVLYNIICANFMQQHALSDRNA